MENLEGLKSGAKKFLAAVRKAMLGEIWMAAETLAAALFFLFRQEVAGVVFFVYVIAVKLIVSDDSLCGFLPFLLIGLMVLRLYDSFGRFMALKFVLGVPAVLGVLFHFIFYRKAPHRGNLSKGYFFLSCALALGGIFSLSFEHYISGTSLYYTYGLGFGLFFLYSLLVRGVNPREEYDIREFVAKTAMYCAIYCIFMIVVFYIGNFRMITNGEVIVIKGSGETISAFANALNSISNNLSTTVLLTMPFLFYLSRKGGARGALCFAVGILEGFASVLTLSRGGMIFSSAMCIFLVCYTLWKDKEARKRDLVILAAILVAAGCVAAVCHREAGILFREGVVSANKWVTLAYFVAALGTVLITAYIYYLFRLDDKKKRNAHIAILSSCFVVGLSLFIVFFDELKPFLIKLDYYRGNMVIIAAKNFKTYPFFGTGMGYRGLRTVYQNKEGMFGCYHCLPVQVVGSLGLFGVAAYLYMFRERLSSLKKSRDGEFAAAVLFSYLGLLWISMVEPGIFCPVVYGLQIAIYFIAAERTGNPVKNPEK